MLTDTKLRNLKPKDKLYKVNDRDGLYVAVTAAGAISFRYNYSIHGRQETITFGRYGVGGITLAEARERLGEAKKMIAAGKSPAKEKARDKARVKDAETFGAWAEKWLRGYQMADSTRDMRRSVYERELKPKFGNQKLVEITHEDLRALTDAIVERGAPATAVHVREVVLQVFRWAIERGQKVENPAELVRPTTIAKFEPRDRALTPDEIGLMYQYMERIGTSAIHPGGGQAAAADDGAQERADQRDLERDQFQRRALDDPEGADEAAQSAPGVSVPAGAGHLHCPENLRRWIGLRAAVAVRLGLTHEQRHAQPGADADVSAGAEGREVARQVRAA
ncbi:hypothetical protein MASR2M16_35350 [Thauera terpenica]